MELKDIYGNVIFALESAKTVLELVIAARAAKVDLRNSDLRSSNLSNSNLSNSDLSNSDLSNSDLSNSDLSNSDLSNSNLRSSNLSYSNLSNSNLRGALIDGKPIVTLRVFSGLYSYAVQAVLFQDGSRWVRMGCLWKSLEEWDAIGIRKSNLSEFPDDGSEKCEERVAAFEFAKAAALRMKLPETQQKEESND